MHASGGNTWTDRVTEIECVGGVGETEEERESEWTTMEIINCRQGKLPKTHKAKA